jgi:hypothetical protein
MAAETWMSAEDAIGFGLADQLTESLKIAAHFDMSKFKYQNAPDKISEPATPKPAEVDEPPEPKLQEPPAVALTEDSPLHPDNFESRDKRRIDTSYGERSIPRENS